MNALEREIVKALKHEQNEKLEDVGKKKGNAAKEFRLKEDILGTKKNQQETMAVNDLATGHAETNPKKIKEKTANFV